jgi:hypothetical protein
MAEFLSLIFTGPKEFYLFDVVVRTLPPHHPQEFKLEICFTVISVNSL